MKCKRLPLAIAVASAMGAGVASADEGNRGDYEKSNIHIDKDVDVTHELHHKGKIYTAGVVLVDSTATALSEVEQKVKENTLSEQQMFIEPNSENPVVMFGGSVDDQNSATLSGNVLKGSTGNAGVNIVGGSTNAQQNSVSIAEGDSRGHVVDIPIEFSTSETFKDNYSDSETWSTESWDNHQVTHTSDTATSSSSSSLSVELDIDEHGGMINADVGGATTVDASAEAGDGVGPEGQISKSVEGNVNGTVENSYVSVQTSGEFDSNIGGDAHSGEGSKDLNSVSAAGEFETDSKLYVEDGSISYMVEGEDEQSWESDSTHTDGTVSVTDGESSTEYVDESDYSFNTEFDINLMFGGAAEAETFAKQKVAYNQNPSSGYNIASISDDVAMNFSGNIGVNVVAGHNNAQANQLALAENDGVMALATATSYQSVYGNVSQGQGYIAVVDEEYSLSGDVDGYTVGYSDQLGDVYPDTWEGKPGPNPHPTIGKMIGHNDIDSDTQGAQQVVVMANGTQKVVQRGYVLQPGEYYLAEGGAYVYKEVGAVDLGEVTLSGTLKHLDIVEYQVVNDASISGNAFMGAKGNIAVNVASGSGNAQGNALAISSMNAPE